MPLTLSISILNPSRNISMSIKSLDLFLMNMNDVTACPLIILTGQDLLASKTILASVISNKSSSETSSETNPKPHNSQFI